MLAGSLFKLWEISGRRPEQKEYNEGDEFFFTAKIPLFGVRIMCIT